jgi:hypothetical protein
MKPGFFLLTFFDQAKKVSGANVIIFIVLG